MEERNSFMRRSDQLEIDHEFTDEVVCPYCGHEYSDCRDFDDEGEMQCYECDKIFWISQHVSISYSTSKLCEENKTEHVWRDSENRPGEYRHCDVCGKCERVEAEKPV